MNKEFRTKVEAALRYLIDNDEDGKDFICSDWILISEWADYNGTRYLHTEVSSEMTPWKAAGMMKLAEDYNSELIDYEPEEDEDAQRWISSNCTAE